MAARKKASGGKKSIKCDICGQTFSMPAHLGRHKAAKHGVRAKTASRRSTKKGKARRVISRKTVGKKTGRKPGRPPAIASRFGLADLGIEELAQLIQAARSEADRRLRDYQRILSE